MQSTEFTETFVNCDTHVSHVVVPLHVFGLQVYDLCEFCAPRQLIWFPMGW